MKYMALINNKIMVAVEENGTRKDAREKILNNYRWIQSVQVLDPDVMREKYFTNMLQKTERITLKELKKRSEDYSSSLKTLKSVETTVEALKYGLQFIREEEREEREEWEKTLKGWESVMHEVVLDVIEAEAALNIRKEA